MKNFAFYFLILISLFSCSKEDDADAILNGRWQLESIEGEVVQQAPPNEVVFVVFENGSYTGKTNVNDFGGDYAVERDSIFLFNSFTTEKTETEWGLTFYESLRNAFNEENARSEFMFILDNTELILKNEEEILIFKDMN